MHGHGHGPNPYGPQSHGPQSHGPHGSQSYGPQSYGPQPYGPQPYGPQPYGPPSPWPSPVYPTAPTGLSSAMKGIIVAAVLIGIMLLGVISSWTSDPNDQPGAISYGVSGTTTGTVYFRTKDVPRSDALTVGEYLNERGWFSRPNAAPGLEFKAMGSYGVGAAGRGSGLPEARIEKTDSGLRVIVYTSAANANDVAVKRFGADGHVLLTKRLGKPTSFIVRVEHKQGKSLAWDDSIWE